jgi:hypothetical protein
MVFAVVGIGHKSQLLIVSGSIDAEKYLENCAEVNFIHDLDGLHGRWNWLYQQDGTACDLSHRALAWPPNSPDLSPIETCWVVLKRAVFVQKPQTVEELKTAIQTSCAGIPQHSLDQLCRSFRARLQLFLDRQGASISRDLWLLSDEDFIEELRTKWQGRPSEWTPEENELIQKLYLVMGSKWGRMREMFQSCTAQETKNRWHGTIAPKYSEKIKDTEAGLKMRRVAREWAERFNVRPGRIDPLPCRR